MNDGVTQAAPATQSATREPVLRISNGSKIYGGVHAIEGVNFDLYPGEVHALVGENGAGKSTLCKAIAGAINLTSGDYLLDGKPANFEQPRDALDAGICMVYQETSLVPTMTAAQNIELGNEKLLTRFRTLNIQAQQLLQSLNFHVDPATPVALLGTAKKQMVEIARAIYNKARIIIFDEPTASLTPEEIVHFFHLVRDLRARGVSIIYISHALEESLQIADRITVLRDGKLVITAPAKQLTRDALVQHMVGREVAQAVYGGREKTHQRREKSADGRECHHGHGGQEHVVLGLCRRGGRHRRPDRLRPHRDRQDRLRRVEAQLGQWRHHPAARQADPLPRAASGDQ
ncbi:ABC-type sugar transport system ATPase subunit [Bradyrhizobium sp. JR6.1]